MPERSHRAWIRGAWHPHLAGSERCRSNATGLSPSVLEPWRSSLGPTCPQMGRVIFAHMRTLILSCSTVALAAALGCRGTRHASTNRRRRQGVPRHCQRHDAASRRRAKPVRLGAAELHHRRHRGARRRESISGTSTRSPASPRTRRSTTRSRSRPTSAVN